MGLFSRYASDHSEHSIDIHSVDALSCHIAVLYLAGALLCFHDNNDAENLMRHLRELVNLLRVDTPKSTINPQGRPIISMPECLEIQEA